MRYIQLRIVLCFLIIAFSPTISFAQFNKIDVSGIVSSAEGKPIVGASLVSEKDNILTVTDSNGKFLVNVPIGSRLSVVAKGFTAKRFTVSSNQNDINLILSKENTVQVAFKKVNERDLSSGISFVDVEEVLNKSYSTYSLDGMQSLVGGFNYNIWGQGGYLVLVDGFPRDPGSILPVEIDQISFLKGVNAIALYGSRAAQGVVYITSKRGKVQKQQISVRANAGIDVPKRYAKYLGSAEYMSYYNQALTNDGLPTLYSDEDIFNHASGNEFRYPNVDYYSSKYLREFSRRYDANVEINGGNEVARYFTIVNFSNNGNLLNFGEAANNQTTRFNARGNVDVAINDFISARLGINAIYSNSRGINANYWQSAATIRPFRYTPLIPIDLIEASDEASQLLIRNSKNLVDGRFLLGGNQLEMTNPFAAAYAGGNSNFISRQFQFNTGVDANLNSFMKGLSLHTDFGIDYDTQYSTSFNNGYAVYNPTWNTFAGFDQIGSLQKINDDTRDGIENLSNSFYRQVLTFSTHLDYKRQIEKNNFGAMFIVNGFQRSTSGQYFKESNANLGLNMSYNFDGKYYAEFNQAIVHSARFAESKRMMPSPTLTLGWRLSEENFLKNSTTVDNLKLSFSAGILHTDLSANNYYLYQPIFSQTDGQWFSWRDGALNRSTDARQGENFDLTFAQRREINATIDASFFKGMITLNSTFYRNQMRGNIDRLANRAPNYFSNGFPASSFVSWSNVNNDDRSGIDFNINFNKKVGAVDLSLGITGNYYHSRIDKRDEVSEFDYQLRQGRPIDNIFGLKNLGFYVDEADIANSPVPAFGTVKPGDIKYQDVNGDGLVNAQDEVFLGKAGFNGAPLFGGLNFTAKWKNFTLFAMATAQFGAYAMKNQSAYFNIDGTDKYSVNVRNSWTFENRETATFPRLTTFTSDNNYRNSDFWMYSTNRFDLSRIQISFDFPKRILQSTFVNELSAYLNGANLLTISQERELMELNIGGAPQTRFFNLGLKASF
ncbi:SusC/RagA family TonB-linked outer membrane protein [Flavobacterium sp. FZUC8N2.13]|uniref:SusC/RagA family TonB-linked outer membrane protein n=1 Tax=Flavobacterium zubiriense TaxID=3138075 RepID=A0ABV4TET6_9FLAO